MRDLAEHGLTDVFGETWVCESTDAADAWHLALIRSPVVALGAHQLARAPRTRTRRLSDRREPAASSATRDATGAADGHRPAASRRLRHPCRSAHLARDRLDRDTRHATAMASSARGAEMDLAGMPRSLRDPRRDRAPRDPDGGRESDVGLHPDPRGVTERRTSGGPLYDCADPQGSWLAPSPAATHVVADISASALGRRRRR